MSYRLLIFTVSSQIFVFSVINEQIVGFAQVQQVKNSSKYFDQFNLEQFIFNYGTADESSVYKLMLLMINPLFESTCKFALGVKFIYCT